MEDQSELIRLQMEDTRSSLSDKIEALEQKVADTVQPVTDAVERTTEAVAETVERVKESVATVAGKVEETVQSVASAFDLRRHAERHPWLVLGVAATSGCIIGTILARSSRRRQSAHEPSVRGRHHARGGDGASHHPEWTASRRSKEKERPAKESLFAEELRNLKGLAISSLLGFVRDLAKRAVPGTIGDRIGDEVDSLTTRMGAKPLRGPVISDSPAGETSQEAVTDGGATRFSSPANRGGIDPGL